MRIKKSPRRQIKNVASVMGDSGKSEQKSLSTWENLAKLRQSFETATTINNQKQPSDICNILDLSLAGPSSSRCYRCWTDAEKCLPLDYTAATLSQNEPIDLSTKNAKSILSSGYPQPRQTQEFKDTFLYKMLTDPEFVENLKVTKNTVVYSCPFCKKQFPDEDTLIIHQQSVINDANKLTCCACNKTFTQKRYLRYHQRSHSETNKFTCYICTKKYSRQDNLTRHNTFHTNPHKFPCIYCERTFSRKDLLNKHMKGHENRFRYHCDVCDKYFKGPLSLENHKNHCHRVNNSGEGKK